MLARNHFQCKHLRMVNMLTARIKTLNGINNMEQSAETSKLDEWNLTGYLKIISHLYTGQSRGCLTGCISRLTHSAHCSAHSPDLHSQSHPSWRLQLPPNAGRCDICGPGPGQALKVNLFNPELISSAPKLSHQHYSLVEEHPHPPGHSVILNPACPHFPQEIICHL